MKALLAATTLLASIITHHVEAFAAFNAHCDPDENPADTVSVLDAAERAARKAFVEYRPIDLAEVRAKAVYALTGVGFTPEDRESVLRSML
jgi:hypothetical protein